MRHLCLGAGCGRAIEAGARFCWECLAKRKGEKTDGIRVHTPVGVTPAGLRLTSGQRGLTDEFQKEYVCARWKKCRPLAFQKYPFCVDCLKAVATCVDHNVPCRLLVAACRRKGLFPYDPMAGFYIIENLRGRCHSCHTKKTQTEMGQDWTAEIDALLSKYRKQAG